MGGFQMNFGLSDSIEIMVMRLIVYFLLYHELWKSCNTMLEFGVMNVWGLTVSTCLGHEVPDIWSNIILGVFMRVILNEITFKLEKWVKWISFPNLGRPHPVSQGLNRTKIWKEKIASAWLFQKRYWSFQIETWNLLGFWAHWLSDCILNPCLF